MANTPIPESTTQRYRVPQANLPELEAKLGKLIKKAAKLGVGAISYGVARETPVDVGFMRSPGGNTWEARPGETPTFFRRYFDVTVTGTIPRLAGWTFLATLDHMEVDGETANLLRVVPGFEGRLPEAFRTADATNCDHCHKRITTRKNTFIVRSEETGEFKQVGRTCTQAFLGGLDPHDVAKMLEYLQLAFAVGDGEGGFGGATGEGGFGFTTFLATVNAVIRRHGWLSRGKARAENRLEQATANLALYALNPPRGDGKVRADWEAFVAELEQGPEDTEIAELTIDFIRDSIDFRTETNDYRYNLRVAFGQDIVYSKLAGIVASGVSFYLKEQQKLKEAAGLRQVTSTAFIGNVDDKVELRNVQLVFKRRLEGNWGGYDLAKFVTELGESVTVFGQVEGAVGEFGTLEGKVVKHDSYQDKPSTQIKGRTLFTSAARLVELEALRAAKKAEKATAAKAAREAKKAAKKAASQDQALDTASARAVAMDGAEAK